MKHSVWILLALVVLAGLGCREVITGRYYIGGEDITTIVGPAGSRHAIALDVSTADRIHQKLGEPRMHFDTPRSELYVGVPSYHWVFDPWPFVVLRPEHGPLVLRLDYDGNGILRRSEVKPYPSGEAILLPEIARVWPDLKAATPKDAH